MDESAEFDCLCWVVVHGGEIDGGMEGQGAMALNGICSVMSSQMFEFHMFLQRVSCPTSP
jgi:hypothetical protein